MLQQFFRRPKARALGDDAGAKGSTSFSLSTSVPRPDEAQMQPQSSPLMKTAKLILAGRQELLIRVNNVSAGGIMAEVIGPVEVGETVEIDFSGQNIPATVSWRREHFAGLKFDADVDLGELLAGRRPRLGFRHRPPRLEIECAASVKVGRNYYQVSVQNISQAGIKVEPIGEYCLGQRVVVVIESLGPVRGEVRWYSDRAAGIVFDKPLAFEQLAEWMGKRLEMASLKHEIGRR